MWLRARVRLLHRFRGGLCGCLPRGGGPKLFFRLDLRQLRWVLLRGAGRGSGCCRALVQALAAQRLRREVFVLLFSALELLNAHVVFLVHDPELQRMLFFHGFFADGSNVEDPIQ